MNKNFQSWLLISCATSQLEAVLVRKTVLTKKNMDFNKELS